MYLQENEPLTKKLLLQNQVFNIPVIKKNLIFAGIKIANIAEKSHIVR
jgi:hypothetical protein